MKLVEEDGALIAAIVHDAALDDEPALLDAVTAAARLTLRSDRLQAELRAEVEYINTVTNTVPSLLASVGTDGRIRNVNVAAVEVAGYSSREEVVRRYYWDVFIGPEEREAMIARFHALAPDFPAGEYENAFVNTRGEERVVYWRSAPLRDENGTVFATSPAARTSRSAGGGSSSSSASATCRRRCSSRCRASWSSSPATARSATATWTIRTRERTARSWTPSAGPRTSSSGGSSSTSSSTTPTAGRREPSPPRPAARRRSRSSRSSGRRTKRPAPSRGRRSPSPTSRDGWTGSCSSAAPT